MNISVIGTGYVGLVTGACFAGSGNNVICVDIDEEKINSLKKGQVTFYEPGLEDVVKKNIKEERLHFTTDLDYAVKNSLIVLIAVGTPPKADGSADTSAVLSVAQSIGKSLNDFKVVVTKSTVPVGTTEMIRDEIKKVTDVDFDVASNPEFLKEGAAVEDFMKPDRVLIGVENESTGEILKELYAPFMRSSDRALVVSIRSSELAKYTANAMLATRISFMNEIANLCEVVGANISEVRVAIGSDDRIGRHFLFPGIGYGGSCFPKDVKALIDIGSKYGSELHVCKATDEVNTKQKEHFWKKIENYFKGQLAGKKISIWGISFKPKTDDIREAPSLFIIEKLLSAGASVTVHDPVAIDNAKAHFGDKVNYADSNYSACEDAEALVINTEWNEYRQPDFQKLKELMNGNVIFDGRNLYKPDTLKEIGLKYFGVGIGN
ncbi:MAG: UDP-glucose/GDP-mannose dehydrogenase family protein [Thermodesulfobacteriota bacterium]